MHAGSSRSHNQHGLTNARDLNKQRRALIESTTRAAQVFAEYDDDNNTSLDFEEFLASQPRRIRESRSVDTIQAWFDAADTDGDGMLSINEFFQFSIGTAAMQHGAAAMDTIFAKYDKDKSGVLDAREFQAVASEMGFGAAAPNIFHALDEDHSGAITYREMIQKLQEVTPTDAQTKALLMTMVWSSDEARKEETGQALKTISSWRIQSRDAVGLRAELHELLKSSGCHVADLLQLFDQDAVSNHQIDDIEFLRALRERFGFRGASVVVFDVFKTLDTDGTGAIGFDELFEFIRGKRHSLDHRNVQVRHMRLQPPPGARCDLTQVRWDVETLRILVQQMLARSGLGTAHLMRAWDRNGDYTVGKKEFLNGVHDFVRDFDHVYLWDSEVRHVAQHAFEQINRRQGLNDDVGHHRSNVLNDAIECLELERWLAAPTKRPPHKLVLYKKRGSSARAPSDASAGGSRDARDGAAAADGEASQLPPLRLSPGFSPWSSSLHVPWSRPLTSPPRSAPRREATGCATSAKSIGSAVGWGSSAVGTGSSAVGWGASTVGSASESPSRRLHSPRHASLMASSRELRATRPRLFISEVLNELDRCGWLALIPCQSTV